MGMALRGRRSERERGREEDGGGERPPFPIISLIPEIRFWVRILPKIKGSLFHSDRGGSRRYIFLKNISSPLSVPVYVFLSVRLFLHRWLTLPFSPFPWHIAPLGDGSFDSSLLWHTAAGKLHLCKCHTEWKDQAGREPQALQGHTNSVVLGSLCLDEVPKAFWWG